MRDVDTIADALYMPEAEAIRARLRAGSRMVPEPGDPCRCGHPAASHDFTDGEPGACYDAGTDAEECWCDVFARPIEEYAPAEGGGSSEAYRAAWRQSDEAHR